MSERTFENLQEQLMELYDKGEYAQALDLAQRESDQFPEHEQATYYWRMCMASRINNTQLALQFFHEALAHGYWFSPKWLRDDEDLKPLQGQPEYEQMLDVCQQRLIEAQANVSPELMVIQPEGEAQSSAPLLIALHGNSSNGRNEVSFWQGPVSSGWLLGIPQSSQLIGDGAYVWDDWEKATQEVREHYAALIEKHAIDSEKVILSGFSMGGGLAIWLTLSKAIKAHGFVVLGPYLRDIEALKPLLETVKVDRLRGYIIVGEQDEVCLNISRKVAELLNFHGIPCELEIRPGLKHTYPADFGQSLAKGIAFVMQE
jgi:predicted esterase